MVELKEIKAINKELSSNWGVIECCKADFGDRRINKRMGEIITKMSSQPEAPLNQSCLDVSETIASYRFMDNEKVTVEKILTPHIEQTKIRATGEKVVLQIQDTTYLNLTSHPKLEGVEFIDKRIKGLVMHNTFAILPSGLPLGVLNINLYSRKMEDLGKRRDNNSIPIEEKESNRWLESIKDTQGIFEQETKVVHICDREGDIFELLQLIESKNQNYVIRVQHNRTLDGKEKLFEALNDLDIVGKITVKIKQNGNRKSQEVVLGIKYKEVTLPIPRGCKKEYSEALKTYCIEAKEINTSENEDLVYWRIFTNIPIESLEEATEKLDWYTKRWAIEDFHKIIKSGCHVEKAHFQNLNRISNYIAMNSIVAWRIYYLVHINRVSPNESATVVFTKAEIDTLDALINKERKRTGKIRKTFIKTVKQAIVQVAKLGGFLDRKRDKDPGITLMWRGMASLAISTKVFLALRG